MISFSYFCKHLAGTQPTKGNESGIPTCAKKHETGDYCTPDSAEKSVEAKTLCRDADFIKIPVMGKKRS
ncbi:MAG: hypothetical protein CVV30_05780 [Methanomicrobiales archaeon HGW-Methanomicrobiales-1]|jgi:hypothetical protein|nr:MAG: hypothetical protein CVV30_05780 [Methanomicrobiales archaeon HGW-Methanomicrobiales-1]